MERFGARLRSAMENLGPLCVGIDPHPQLLTAWGLSDDAAGLRKFCETCVSSMAGRVAVVKPQSAFFERHGAAGVSVLESTIRQLRDAGTLVLLDVKRGDIGSTAAAYADAYLDPTSPLASDAITASPYLGFGSLRPMIDRALDSGAGVFVLALTSNPEGAQVQRAVGPDKTTVAQAMINAIAQVNEGVAPMGDIGAVIGATVGRSALELSTVNGPLLAPGLGAQGGKVDDLVDVFGDATRLVLPSYSREILGRGPRVEDLRAAVTRTLDDVRRLL
ncbi:orotidine 5'-phosphate decarboxylase [Virgisporangium aliadipatigenens]|uniref:Orotidine 5'-phosphate decarboxylase n=1 Tax=Virgisporangium aliadipatigenens TaxID=741659 RepID=A0A8J3YNR5_9ACTN|nr:orotidine-5'-phosphate decarboxylase [Virgisporangium aliadipatigenens]GIJ47807.1 orotidine 5'-phosphate decarboxylase [Virgisporangium aliadipatigenens]